ncbi:hypothetical protein OH687_35855 [Burkholderia anthina]|nr:hypothetical protein OH687_35855 [Burkholderia anthina]
MCPVRAVLQGHVSMRKPDTSGYRCARRRAQAERVGQAPFAFVCALAPPYARVPRA